MPKETVYGSQLPYGTPEEPGEARSIVQVLWSREGEHVQVVSKCVNAADGTPWRVSDKGKGNVSVDFTEGFYVDLDRGGINALIRHLRRARDQAFGRDE